MSSKPQLPAIRTARAPPPSTISKTSSESSNATIRPAIRTPRAESPTSRQLPFSNRAIRSNRPLSILGRRLPGSNEAGWDGPGLDNTVWEENTVLDGLAWRLEQFLDIRPPYGLITPEMVAAARQDMKICGPALDMLVSATLADGNAPIWELPVVETDESGLKHASQTLPFSDLNCPEALRGLFKRWANAAVRVAKLESHLQQEIARNICDMELATNVVVPQVNDLAKEFKGIAVEVIRRKTFLSRVTERIKEELRRNDRATLLLPKTRTRLDVVGEVNEPPMSQNSSRSSSRASHRSRSRSHSHSRGGSISQSGAYGVGSSEGGVYQSTRPRGSSTSLRLGDDGVPLPDDGAEYGGERIATGPEMSSSNRAALIKSGPRPPSRSQQPENILYGGLLPINIPAFPPGVQEAPTAPAAPSLSNLPADITTGAAHSTSTSDPPSAPFLTLGQQDPNQNMFSSPSHSQTYTATSIPSVIQVPSQLPSHPDPLGVLHLQPMNPNGLGPGPVPSLRGPRPLPQRPTRSPLPQLPGEQRQSPPTTIVNHRYQNPAPAPPPAPPPAPINLGSNFVVPGQAGPSTGVIFDLHSIQVPSETPSFVIPSDSPAPPLEYDLRAARHRYAMSSSSTRSYNGAGPSGSRPRTPSPPTLPPLKEVPRPSEKPVISPRAPAVDDEENLDLVAIRETMYSSMSDALASQVLRPVIDKDAKRAYYSAVCLAILNVGMTVQPESNDTPNLISMMEREIRLSDLPGPYKTCFTQLAAIGREARKLREDDDERAIAYVARGKPLPEPRIGRVQKLLERGVGYVGPDGRIRGTSNSSGGTGRSREFTSKITALALEIMKLSAFREDMLPMLVA
ncbi:hypothetical protein FRC15_006471 [Serendipita sp. 397]|nr:hypothetical protein FRC15_006471 [Serendipita sp. 397]